MIEFEGVYFAYGKKEVLKDVSFRIEKGETVCITGKSGRGKTTLLRLICGLEKPKAGKITNLSESISAVFQEDRLIPFKSAKENVLLFCEDEEKTDKAFNKLGLENEKNSDTETLSGGMKRRVAVIRALLKKSDLLILDEPFTGLDEETKRTTAEFIRENAEGRTVILSAHDKDEALLINENCRFINF